MRNQIFKAIKYTLAGSAVLLTLAVMFGFIDPSFIIGHSPYMLGMAAGAGASISEPVTTENANPETLRTTIDKNITLMHPDKYPFDTILREMGIIVPVQSWKTEYFEVDTRPLEDTVATAFAGMTADSPAWSTADIIPTSLYMYTVDDNILVNGIAGNDSKDLVLHVVAITATALTVVAVNGTGANQADIPAIPADTPLTRIGNAKEETASQTTPFSTQPQSEYNYCQIHMAQVEQSLYDKLHAKYVNWDLADFRSEALWNMRAEMEFTSLFGVRNKIYDPVAKKWKYMSGGAYRYIDNIIPKTAATFDNPDWVDIAQTVFNGNNGSETRVIFAGSGALSTMAKAPSVEKQIDQRDVLVKWGVKFSQIETNYGSFLAKHHPLLDKIGWTNNAFILDMSNVEKHVFKGLETNTIDFNASGQRKTTGDVIDEAFCTVYKNPDTHNILKFT